MCPFFASAVAANWKVFLYIFVRNFAGLGDYNFCDAFLKKAIFAFIVVDKSGDGCVTPGRDHCFPAEKLSTFAIQIQLVYNLEFQVLHFVVCILGDWHSMFFVCNSVQLGVGKVIVITVHLGVGRAGIFKESPRNKAVNCEERLLYRPQIWTLNALSLNEVR